MDGSDIGPLPPPFGLCALVRRSCAQLMESAQHVTIDAAGLDRLTSVVDSEGPPVPPAAADPITVEPSTAPSQGDDREADALLVLALDAINFGSGYHDVIAKPAGLSGARTMERALRAEVAGNGALTAERLRSMSPSDCARIFGQSLDDPATCELMTRFGAALYALGALVERDGPALELIRSAGGSAERLAEILTAMPFCRDEVIIDDGGEAQSVRVAFYKRAQISAADLHRSGLASFDDLDHLTAFADNLVPHVLRVDGVLEYQPELAAAIDSGTLLTPGGRAECEIRAAGVFVVDVIAQRIGRRAMDLDLWLWERGGAGRYKAVPRHRARSVFY